MAIFISLCWGCEYAWITFAHVWCLTPGMRLYTINCSQCQKCFGTIVNCMLLPLYEIMGICFSNIHLSENGKPGHQTKIPQIKVP